MSERDASALRALAERVGLAREYVTAWGHSQEIADETLRTLLTALGLPSASDEEAARSLTAFEELSWGRALEPVTVAEAGAPVTVLLTAGQSSARRPGEWRVRTEDGRVFDGTIDLGRLMVVAERGVRVRRRLELPDDLPLGYHTLEVNCDGKSGSASLIVVPTRAYAPGAWSGEPPRRDWAITAQLYSLRSDRNWGIGDFSDLATLGHEAAARGAAAIGLNPLHALFPANPTHVSPYSPSSRAFLNPVYIDVTEVPEFAGCAEAHALIRAPAFQARLHGARGADLVDYPEVWSLKRPVLEALHRRFRAEHLQRDGQPCSDRGHAFRRFRAKMGEPLRRFAIFEALQEHFVAGGEGLAWREWPSEYRDPASDEVADFAREHEERIEFSEYLQWEADRQLGRAARLMREAGMTTGLYRDVAVGVDPNGAEAWSDQPLLVAGASVGAPPDIFNPKGQDWGLTPFNPLALRERAYGPFIAAIRANMRHAGAVRIDHVIGLQRLWWVPRDAGPADGAYVRYPFDDLVGIIALESERHRCFVVGEDLGTVPDGFREEMHRRRILSYRLLMFERENGDGEFLPPADYPALAAAAVSTHDLATLQGLWRGRDLEWRRELALYPNHEQAAKDVEFRTRMREELVDALAAEGGLTDEAAALLRDRARGPGDGTRRLAEAVHRFLGRAPARFMLVQIEDLIGELEQMNLPGTVDEHPNWRRKLPLPVETAFEDELAQRIVRAVDETRREPLTPDAERRSRD